MTHLIAEPTMAADLNRSVVSRLNQLRLTQREKSITRLLLLGWSNKDIAASCRLHEQTVKEHLQRVYAKLGVHNRAAFIASFYREWITSILQDGR